MKKKLFAEHRRFWLGLGSVLFVLAAWEVLLTYVFPLNPFFFTKPSLIAVAFKEQVIYGALWGDLAVSSKAFLWGFSFAILLGIPLGALMGWLPLVFFEAQRRLTPRTRAKRRRS